jgi:hypothetical protein
VKELQIRFAIFYAPASLLIFRSGTCMPGFSHHLFPEYTMHSVARGLITIALLLPAVFSPSFGFGQNVERMTTNSAKENPVPAHRPVIGIALSGGGALALFYLHSQWSEDLDFYRCLGRNHLSRNGRGVSGVPEPA